MTRSVVASSASRSATSTAYGATVLPCGLSPSSCFTAARNSSDSRASMTTVRTSLSASKNRRTVARPMPFDAPVTISVLPPALVSVVLAAEQEVRQSHVGLRRHLEVAVGAVQEVHLGARDRAQRRVLGEREPFALGVRVGGDERRLVEL